MRTILRILHPLAAVLAVIVIGVFLHFAFAGSLAIPQVVDLGFTSLRIYGLILALAISAAYVTALKTAAREKLDNKELESFLLPMLLGGFMGARLYHVLSSLTFYRNNPSEILAVWHGGLSIYGAVMGGLVAMIAYRFFKRSHLSLGTVLDLFVPGLLLGQSIGRFGNFFNYELFGYPTKLPWKMFVPETFRPNAYIDVQYFHPLFLYESLFTLSCFGLVVFLYHKNYSWFQKIKTTPGTLFLAYVFMYNLGRFFLEFLRIDSVFIGNIRQNVVVSAILMTLALGCLIYRQYGSISQNSKSYM